MPINLLILIKDESAQLAFYSPLSAFSAGFWKSLNVEMS